MSTTYDVIIVGAGSVGVPAALAMAQAGVDVLVIDSAASPGQGSHKAAIGGVRATHSDPAKIRLCLRSLEIFATWEAVCGRSIEWSQGGYSFVAYREQERAILQELLAVQHRYGLNIDWLEGDALLEIVPDLNPEGLLGGTFSPEDGHCSTLLAGHAFYEEAVRAGATFRFGETVTGVAVEGGRVGRVTTSRHAYSAPVVVNAAGAWARKIDAHVAAASDAALDHPVNPDSHEAGVTEPVVGFLRPMIVDIRPQAGSANCYFFQLASGQILFCLTPDPPVPGFDCRDTSEFLPLVARRMLDLVPKLANLRVRRTWRGLYPMTPDGSPLVGWAGGVDGYLVAIGMCGQGFMLGPGLGELLARMVTQTSLSPQDQEILTHLSPARPFHREEALK
jgi:sarcosine oxidase, subunit beta